MIDLYNPDGTLFLQAMVGDNSQLSTEIMQVPRLELHLSLTAVTTFPMRCYCTFEGVRYTLYTTPEVSKQNSRAYDYTLLMYPDAYLLKTRILRDYDGRLSFPLTATAYQHLTMLITSMGVDTWRVGQCLDWDATTGVDSGKERLVSYDQLNCFDALTLIANTFETEFEIVGNTINLRKVEYRKDTPLPMSYGRGNGFRSGVSRRNADDTPPLDILYVLGGEKNINPAEYGRNENTDTFGSRNLLLPFEGHIWYDGTTFYPAVYDPETYSWTGENIPTNAHLFEAVERRYVYDRTLHRTTHTEGCYQNDDIYPQRVGTVSQVVTVNAAKNEYDIVDYGIPDMLNYDDCLIVGQNMTLKFQSGQLAGREFDVRYVHDARAFEIKPSEIDGMWMPGENFLPSVGDTYAVFGCQLPEAYLNSPLTASGAEWDLMRAAVAHLWERQFPQYTFSGEVDPLLLKRAWSDSSVIAGGMGQYMAIGYHILFSDNIVDEPLLLRVTAMQQEVNRPHHIQLTLSNALREPGLAAWITVIEGENLSVRNNAEATDYIAEQRRRRMEEDLGVLAGDMSTYSEAQASLGGRITEAENTINTVRTTATNAQTTANNLQNEVSAARAGATTLNARINAVENGIPTAVDNALEKSLPEALEEAIGKDETISGMQEAIDGQAETIGQLVDYVNQLQEAIAGMGGDVPPFDGDGSNS